MRSLLALVGRQQLPGVNQTTARTRLWALSLSLLVAVVQATGRLLAKTAAVVVVVVTITV